MEAEVEATEGKSQHEGGAFHATASLLLLSVQTDRNLISYTTKHAEADIRSQIHRRIIDYRSTLLSHTA